MKFLKAELNFILLSSYMLSFNEGNISKIHINNLAFSSFKSEKESLVFTDVDSQINDEIQISSKGNYSNGELFSNFYFADSPKKDLIEGELYKTKYDTKESLAYLKEFIVNKLKDESLYFPSYYNDNVTKYGNFKIGNKYISLNNKTKIRAMSCTFNNNVLGVMTDYENIFILNKSSNNNNNFYILVTHQTYLSPVKTDNRNYKGVGVEFRLSRNKSYYDITRYGPSPSSNNIVIVSNNIEKMKMIYLILKL